MTSSKSSRSEQRKLKRLTAAQISRINDVSSRNALKYAKFIEEALRGIADADKEKRLDAQACKWCFYFRGPTISGQGFTDWDCQYCSNTGTHSTTDVPYCCEECAEELALCRSCGGAISFRFSTARRRTKKRG